LPTQPEDNEGCTPSYLALIIWREKKNISYENKIVIDVRDSAWRTDVAFDKIKDPSPAPLVLAREGLATQLTMSVMATLSAIALVLA
jgi:hypothetical protein